MNEGESRELYRFQKNSGEDLVFKIHRYKGTDYFDIRVWKKPVPGISDESTPTKKGVTVAMDHYEGFTEGIGKLNEAYYQGASREKPR